jgi:DNA-directed RNA polymerase beta subunit
MKDPEALLRIADLVNSKSVSSSIEYFFGRGELSQVVDQTNALSMLTHERRLSALGPGGLNRKRAGFEVRDVHISHYGRICPIETPEGTNIGLIASLSIFSAIDDYGFLITPYRVVKDGKVVTSGAKTQRNKSEVKSDKEAESTITKWMQDKLECVALPLDIPDKEVSELANKMKSLLTTKRDKDSDVNTVLGFLEDRLMLEFPDETNPKGGIAPYFNRDLPKDSPDRIIMVWKESVPAQLVEWIKNALALVKSRSCEWTTGFENVKKVPGVYLFRQASKSSKIVYVGIAGDSLYTRLGQHWGKTNVEGSGLRWHIWQDKIEGGPDVVYLRADEEMEVVFAPPSAIDIKNKQKVTAGTVLARKKGDLAQVNGDEIDYIDISPKQVVGVSAALIPFLEHDDANRALMGSNMQRQAVPLLTTEAPLVGTGMEGPVAQNSSMVVLARKSGTITAIDATHIVIDDTDEYELEKFIGLNERTCLNQRPIVKLGEKVKKGQIIADGGGTDEGELALGKNILVAFVPFDGYNFEDAILISEKLVRNDVFTSIHIDEFSVEVRETKLGREEFTRDIPNVSEKALRNLDESGVVCEGTRVAPGDILVGKVSPKSKTELTPEEKLLHAIFGRAGEDVKNDSLEVPSGYEGVVIQTKRFIRRGAGSEDQQKAQKAEIKKYEAEMKAKECKVFKQMIEAIHEKLEVTLIDPSTRQKVGASEDLDVIYEQIENFSVNWVKPANMRDDVQKVIDKYWPKIGEIQEERKRKMDRLKHGDELPSGVLEMVKVYVATKRAMSIGDKMAGRHGNKGVIARIMPEEDMPFLEDGTSVEILLNPLGVPSRMNVGQILETHLGWVAKVLGFNAVTPVFDGADEEQIQKLMIEANEHAVKREKELAAKKEVPPADEVFAKVLPSLKTKIYDGRTGEPFEQTATIGYIYMMKLHHLVDDKIHARATGPYSLITQQPLGGKARTGGQRFGEMEVWALEGYGAAYTLQELLTVKSDDIEGRTKIYESMVKGENTLEAGTPISFDVLCNEIRGLGLNIQLEKKRLGNASL